MGTLAIPISQSITTYSIQFTTSLPLTSVVVSINNRASKENSFHLA
jgi:hypothetical protein